MVVGDGYVYVCGEGGKGHADLNDYCWQGTRKNSVLVYYKSIYIYIY